MRMPITGRTLLSLCAAMSLSATIVDSVASEAESVEPCSQQTNALVQAVLDYMIAEQSPAYGMEDAVERGTVYMYRTTYRSSCALDGLAHDAVQIVFVDEEQHDDLARNLRGVSALRIVSIDYVEADVAEVYIAALLAIAHDTIIDRSLGCGKRMYMSRSDGAWRFDVDMGSICS